MVRRLLLALAVSVAALSAAEWDREQLLARARTEAAEEVQFHLLREYARLSDFVAKVRKVEEVPGWSQVRAEGDAAFAVWDRRTRDYAWRTEKFEVLWDVTSDGELKLNSVSFGGIARRAEP